MRCELVRYAYAPGFTLGYLLLPNLRVCTLEEPWSPDPDGPGGQKREIGKKESCVPDGLYVLHPHNGAKFRDVWALENRALGVWRSPLDIPKDAKYGRSAILIHNGQSLENTLGCILVGMSLGFSSSGPYLTESQKALDAVRAILGGGSHILQIRPRAGTAEVV